MNRYLIVSGIAVLFICVGLSGCEESLGGNEVEIVNYEITTHWGIHEGGLFPTDYSEIGFYHNLSADAVQDNSYYEISGTLKNTAGEKLDSIIIDVVCYDVNGIELFNTGDEEYTFNPCYDSDTISNLPDGYSEDFTIKIYEQLGLGTVTCKYWDEVDSFDFIITIT